MKREKETNKNDKWNESKKEWNKMGWVKMATHNELVNKWIYLVNEIKINKIN